ncbi:MAG TPA: asparagine synthase (glutamine-hydrolyzing), partial [Polyangia bacterium]|nr:asparagine synthase (glutamine-hydrolyzing) [Polyangia bacterium]
FGAVLERNRPCDGEAALATLRHRGPDDARLVRKGECVLGHTRLAILDLSPAAAQPMSSEDGQVTVVFNGEIYNHHELRAELRSLGHQFRSRSDTEVIVEGYRAWGDGVVRRLDGMFAIGIWDAPRRRLLLARDRAGKKPLYYTDRDGGFRFASEVKALIASGVSAAIDTAALPMLLAFGYTAAPRSMYKNISQLPPATMLTLTAGRPPQLERYWRAPFASAPLAVSADQAVTDVRRLVERAVERRLEADVPLGAFLSGGIDSSIIVGVMARRLGRKVKTFSIGFAGDARYDETAYARIAARAFDTDHVEFTLEPSSFDLIERLVDLHDGPFGDSSAIPTSVVAQLTRRHVTVALTGDGGDELFCGYYRFLAAEAAERMPTPVRRIGGWVARHLPAGQGERGMVARGRRFLMATALEFPERLARLNSLFAFELDRMLTPELRAEIDASAPLAWTREIVAQSAGASTLARVLEHNFETYLPYDLLVKADRASMAHSLEVRSPFLDTELIEYAARLPDHLKRRGITTKWILKRAFADLLPPEILKRGKMGFGIPLGTWFRQDLRTYLQDQLCDGAALYDYVDRRFVHALVDEHLGGRADHGHRLWLLLTLEVWLRRLRQRQVACAA